MDWELKETEEDIYKAKHKCICDQFHNISHLDLETSSNEDTIDLKNDKTKYYQQLQQDVDNLEYEVQSFLDSLKSQKSRIINT